MTERDNGEAYTSDLKYGRDIYVKLFQDENPLINLGYSAKQIQFTRRALLTMEEEGTYFPTPKPRVYFGDPDGLISENLNPHVWLTTLKNGGFKAIAEYPLLWMPDRNDEEKGYISSGNFKSDLPLEEFPGEVVAVIDMLPAGKYDEEEVLVRHLYEGAWLNHYHERNPQIGKPNFANWLRSRFSTSVAAFRSGWVDENTKLELVVETDIYSRLKGLKGSHFVQTESGRRDILAVTEVWRRLPEIEHEGAFWVPFGKKPNPSRQSIQKALEGKTAVRTALGKLVTNR